MSKPTIDGVSSGVTVYSYTGEYYSSAVGKIESYSFAIVKTAPATYSVLTSQAEAATT
jgi:hypothetical protein